MITSTEAIVLKVHNYSEADLMLTMFTEKMGKISVYAKNARKLKSKINQSSQILAYSKINLDLSFGMYKLHSSELIDSFYHLSTNIDKYYFAFYMLDTIKNLMPENQANTRAFKLLINILKKLKTIDDTQTLKLIFQAKLLTYQGIKPHINTCIECGQNLNQNSNFSYEGGGMICQNCKTRLKKQADPYDKTTFLALDYLLENPVENALKAKIAPTISKELEQLLEKYYKQNA